MFFPLQHMEPVKIKQQRRLQISRSIPPPIGSSSVTQKKSNEKQQHNGSYTILTEAFLLL
jgi:hypothetical protein